jgi:hypothetical protein
MIIRCYAECHYGIRRIPTGRRPIDSSSGRKLRPHEGRVLNAEPTERRLEVLGTRLAAPSRGGAWCWGDVWSESTEAIDDRVIDRLESGKAGLRI